MTDFLLTRDDPAAPATLRFWALQRRNRIEHGKDPDTAGARARIAEARALADDWEQAPTPPASKPGVIARLLGRV